LAQQNWRIQLLIKHRPPNIFYTLRNAPFPAQVLEYSERDQLTKITVFVHSIHSPRIVFDVCPNDLRPYKGLPRNWQILLDGKSPPLFDLSTLPPGALKSDEVSSEEGHDRSPCRRPDPRIEALRPFRRIGRWLFW
jgi:hypothetical protein